MHRWREFAELLNVPYCKKFSTYGWGDFKITSKGIYSYETNSFDIYKETNEYKAYAELFLNGDIQIKLAE